ncbi:hypothetical protein KSS87_023506, partial [Heliosperma pusillum]
MQYQSIQVYSISNFPFMLDSISQVVTLKLHSLPSYPVGKLPTQF